jgi:hypothetical protein
VREVLFLTQETWNDDHEINYGEESDEYIEETNIEPLWGGIYFI